MRDSPLALCLLAGLLLCMAPAAARAEERSDAQVQAALCSPLEGVRREALFALAREPARARGLARTWVAHARPDLREQAWRLLQEVGEFEDVSVALGAAKREDEGPAAAAAASAALTLAARFPGPKGPWLDPEEVLTPERCRVFALAITPHLRQSTDVPQAVMHLGEASVPWLLQAYHGAPDDLRVRNAVVRSLGRLASSEARSTLAGFTNDMSLLDRKTWFDAMRACGNGPEFDLVHEWIARLAQSYTRSGRRNDWPRGRSWRSRSAREALYRFLAQYPDDRWASTVRERLRGVLGTVTRWNVSLVVSAARALLVLGDPTDDDLELIVDAGASPPWPRPDPGRFEGLGDVFRALRGYRDRAAFQEELVGRNGAAVPRTSRAWIALLSDEGSEDEARSQANRLLLDEPPLAPCLKAGARILDAVGGPGPELVRVFIAHGDPWLRAWAIRWAPKKLPEAECAPALLAAGRDAHEGVALVAAERIKRLEGEPALVERMVRIAAFHESPGLRARAWRILERVLPTAGSLGTSTPTEDLLPRGDAGMDERLRGAALVRAILTADSLVEDHDEALPEPADEGK